MKRELGDIMWYWISACRALNIDPNEAIEENVKKMERYVALLMNSVTENGRISKHFD